MSESPEDPRGSNPGERPDDRNNPNPNPMAEMMERMERTRFEAELSGASAGVSGGAEQRQEKKTQQVPKEEEEEEDRHFFNAPGDTKLAVLGDVSVRANETYCLEEKAWLHDNLMEFYLEYLRHVKHKSQRDNIEIVGPTVTQCIKMSECSRVVSEMLDPLNLLEKKMVLIPVNNASQADSEGSHWSLLILVPSNGHFYHMDSLDFNKDSAVILAIKMSQQLKLQEKLFENFTGTRQDNAVDCGLYVLVNADKSISHFTENETKEGFQPAGKPDISNMRRTILHVIESISQQQERGVQMADLTIRT